MLAVLLDERQREINTRRDPCRCVDVSVADINRLGVDADAGILSSQLLAVSPMRGSGSVFKLNHYPMRGRPPILQQTGVSQIERTSAYRTETPDARGPSPGARRSVLRWGHRPHRLCTAGNQQSVDIAVNFVNGLGAGNVETELGLDHFDLAEEATSTTYSPAQSWPESIF
jgi:hypothetical protein